MATMAIPISKNLDEKMTEFLSVISENTSFLSKAQTKQLNNVKEQRRQQENIKNSLEKIDKHYLETSKTKDEYLKIMSNYGQMLQQIEEHAEKKEAREEKINLLKEKSILAPKFLKNYYDKQLEYMEIDEAYKERSEQIAKMQKDGKLTPSEARIFNLKNRLYKYYDKYLVKGNFFNKVMTTLKHIAKGVWDAAEGWLMKFLQFLFLIAIFDPDGTFLASIMNMLTKAVVFLIGVLAKHLPRIVKTFIHLLVNVLPPLLVKMIESIFPMIGKMFDSFAASFGKDSAIGIIFSTIGEMFKKGGVLYEFFTWAARNLPIIIGAFIALKVILFLIASPILAVVAALVLLYAFSDKIYDFFETFPIWLEKKLGFFGKILGWVFEALVQPLKPVFVLLKAIKKFGFKKTFEMIWDNIKNLGSNLWKAIKEAFSTAIDKIKNLGANAIAGVKEFGSSAITRVMSLLGKFADWLYEVFMGTIYSLSGFFGTLKDNPTLFFGLGSTKGAREKAITISSLRAEAQGLIASGKIKKEDYVNDKGALGRIIRDETFTDDEVEKETLIELKKISKSFQDLGKGQAPNLTSTRLDVSENSDKQKTVR